MAQDTRIVKPDDISIPSTGSVTLAEMANLANGAIIGRSTAGTGVPEAITLRRGEWVSVGTITLAASAPPQSLTDAMMTGLTAGGSIVEPGTVGVLAASYSAVGNETGTGAGGAGLGAAAAANRPYPVADYPGIYSDLDLACRLTKIDGDDVIVADIIPLAAIADLDAPVRAFLSYRSDLGADAKWRLWLYYRASTGLWTPATPTSTVSSVTVTIPRVVLFVNETVRGSLGAPRIGNVAAEVGANSIPLSGLVQAAARYNFVGRASSGGGNYEQVAGTSAGFAMLTAADAAAQTALLNAATTSLKGTVQLGINVAGTIALSGDVSESAGTFTDATGLAITPGANETWFVEFFCDWDTAATTTGLQLGFGVPSGLNYGTQYLVSPTSGAAQAQRLVDAGTANPVLGTAAFATTQNPAWGWCLVQTGASPSGSIQLKFRSEVGASQVTLKAGSFIRYKKIA